jgi:hypothetical protein
MAIFQSFIENHHVSWLNPLFLWPFSTVMLVYQRVILLKAVDSDRPESLAQKETVKHASYRSRGHPAWPGPSLSKFKTITLWLFNIAMENGPFIDGLPIKNGDFPWLC